MRLETEQIWKIWRSNKGLCSYKVLQYRSKCLYYLFSWIINELFCYEWSVFLVFCCNKNCRENKQVQVYNPLLAILKSKKQRKPKFLIHATHDTGVRHQVYLIAPNTAYSLRISHLMRIFLHFVAEIVMCCVIVAVLDSRCVCVCCIIHLVCTVLLF
jgi:hypothetical protein